MFSLSGALLPSHVLCGLLFGMERSVELVA